MEIKKYRGIIFHDTEQWYKIWIKLDLKVSKLTMMGSFWPKRNASARKFQRNYVSWHWKAMQNLSENWFVVWKMTRVITRFMLITPKIHLKIIKLKPFLLYLQSNDWNVRNKIIFVSVGFQHRGTAAWTKS